MSWMDWDESRNYWISRKQKKTIKYSIVQGFLFFPKTNTIVLPECLCIYIYLRVHIYIYMHYYISVISNEYIIHKQMQYTIYILLCITSIYISRNEHMYFEPFSCGATNIFMLNHSVWHPLGSSVRNSCMYICSCHIRPSEVSLSIAISGKFQLAIFPVRISKTNLLHLHSVCVW